MIFHVAASRVQTNPSRRRAQNHSRIRTQNNVIDSEFQFVGKL